MKKRIVAASSYSCIQGLRRSVLFSFLNRWAWIGWSTLNNKQMLLVCLKILVMRRGEARESGRFFADPHGLKTADGLRLFHASSKLCHTDWYTVEYPDSFSFESLRSFLQHKRHSEPLQTGRSSAWKKIIICFFFILSALLCISLMKMNLSLFAETVNEL